MYAVRAGDGPPVTMYLMVVGSFCSTTTGPCPPSRRVAKSAVYPMLPPSRTTASARGKATSLHTTDVFYAERAPGTADQLLATDEVVEIVLVVVATYACYATFRAIGGTLSPQGSEGRGHGQPAARHTWSHCL